MEKRIKILYVITIAAILVFLGMQTYWLHGRYEASLNEQEDRIFILIKNAMNDYFKTYYNQRKNSNYITSYRISKQYGDSGPKSFKATIAWYERHEINEYPVNDTTKTDDENIKESMKILESARHIEKTYEASNAPTEGDVWTAMQKADLEFGYPMTVDRMDSLMASIGIEGRARLVESDTMVWNYSVSRHSSLWHPMATANIPYSELDRKSAEVKFPLTVAEVLKEMGGSLAIVGLISIFLILCLIFQINTVMKLSRLDKMRNSFISTMIHELKRPISTLKMCVSGLDNNRMVEDKEIREELLSETRNALDNLSAYFSKLRDITFNNVEQIPLNIQSVNLHDLFDNVIDATLLPSEKTVVINNRITPDAIVSADRSHLFNILSNLIENAVKYSGQDVDINATASYDEGRVELRVSDNGYGISSGDLKHIFQRFYRGKASAGEQPGMGLGLAYVKLLVEAHGGEISVESTEGRGTCFTIKLPQ